MWQGDYKFLLKNLILKDFRIRYRNMSLGVLWSLVNPLVMMGMLTLVFTKFLPGATPNFPLFVLCGIVVHSFFGAAWASGTTSIVDNAGLVKRVPVPREIVPVAAVLSNTPHLAIQLALLLALSMVMGAGVTVQWLWLPLLLVCGIVFALGLALATSALNVYIRDTRYIVDSLVLMTFWLVPIIYPLSYLPQKYIDLFLYNPLAALIVSLRAVLMDGQAPNLDTVSKLVFMSVLTLAAGHLIFRSTKARVYDHL